jgi:hypothetical protein
LFLLLLAEAEAQKKMDKARPVSNPQATGLPIDLTLSPIALYLVPTTVQSAQNQAANRPGSARSGQNQAANRPQPARTGQNQTANRPQPAQTGQNQAAANRPQPARTGQNQAANRHGQARSGQNQSANRLQPTQYIQNQTTMNPYSWNPQMSSTNQHILHMQSLLRPSVQERLNPFAVNQRNVRAARWDQQH